MRVAQRNCPICTHEQVEVLHSQRFALPQGHPLTDGYEVVWCQRCGFVYADTAVPQAAYDRFYAQYSKYEDSKTGTGGVENPYDWVRQQETAQQIADFLKDPNSTILDVGCANGGLLKALQELGYHSLCGIDPSPICVENTRRLGINAYQGSLFQPFKEHAFDCIILSHTLEHVQDITQAALWLHDNLKADGYLYLEVPDAQRYADFVDAPFQDFNTEHINHFSLNSLRNYLGHNGFEPLQSGQKVISASANKPYPALYYFAKQTETASSIEKDTVLRPAIEQYINKSRNILNDIETRLHRALAKTNRVIVWGTGQLAMKLLVETSLSQARIVAFVDSNPINQGKILRGVEVISPETVSQFTQPILISSTLHQQSIIDQIRKMGLRNELILLQD